MTESVAQVHNLAQDLLTLAVFFAVVIGGTVWYAKKKRGS